MAIVYVSSICPEALDDLNAAAAKAGVPRADLFDVIQIRGVSPDFETIFEDLREVADRKGNPKDRDRRTIGDLVFPGCRGVRSSG